MHTVADGDGAPPSTGSEWLIDASGCRSDTLRSLSVFAALFEALVRDLGLRPLHPAVWHAFPRAGGLTGLLLLAESHLTCHTFPERGFVAVNLYCCRERPEWPWARELGERLGATAVEVRRLARGAPSAGRVTGALAGASAGELEDPT